MPDKLNNLDQQKLLEFKRKLDSQKKEDLPNKDGNLIICCVNKEERLN